MAHPGPNVAHRTLRKRALEIGTIPEGFIKGVDYDPQAGVPSGMPGIAPPGKYAEQEPHVTDTGAKSIDTSKPFVLGK